MVTASAKGKRPASALDSDDDDDEDDISVTSTVDENAAYDQEYLVKDILAESTDDENGKLYLVEWADYALEHCTWEPEQQIGPEIVDEFWTKSRQQPDYKPFNLNRYYEAVAEWNKRHQRRNAKRKRCGLPQTKLDSSPELEEEKEEEDVAVVDPPPPPDANKKADAPKTRQTAETAETAEKSGSAGPPPKKKKKTVEGTAASVLIPPARKAATSDAATTKPKERPPARREAKKPAPPPASAAAPSRQLPELAGRSRPVAAAAAATTTTAVVPRKTTSTTTSTAKTATSSNVTGPVKPAIKTTVPATARRTTVPTQRLSASSHAGSGNAFSEGRRPRKSTLLENAAGDPTRHSSYFNYRVRRISELRERARPEAAIDPTALSASLFPITAGPSSRPEIGAQEAPAGDGQPKKKRTVRFLDDSDSSPGREATPTTANSSEKRVPAVPIQSVKRTLVLGPRHESVTVMMDGKVLAGGVLRLADIIDDRPLQFEHVCLAETLAVRFKQIRKDIVFHGNVSAVAMSKEKQEKHSGRSPGEVLETVAIRLETMASGLFLAWPRSGILLYPARGEEWREEEMFGLPVLQNTTKAPLRCVVFTSLFDMMPFLRSPSEKQEVDVLDVPPDISVREHLMQRFFHFERADYLPLFPATVQDIHAGQRSLFLAFPPTLGESMYQLAKWLRMIDPQCLLYLCSQAGAWRAFQHRAEMSKKKPDFGAVMIVHELATWSVRRFPGICSLAEQTNCRVWSLSQAMMETALFPFQSEVQVRPGHVHWKRLFPDGMAILVTPSFVVTEPERTAELLMWFFHVRQTFPEASFQMMVPANFGHFLLDLAEERACQRDMLLNDRTIKKGKERDEHAVREGITHALCQCRFKAWLFFCRQQRLYRAHRHREGVISGEEETEEAAEAKDNEDENGPYVYADTALDSNDEQSLVNYFAYWATERLDKFRSFCVVGSNNSATQKSRARRRIRIPDFADDLMDRLDSARESSTKKAEVAPTAMALAARRAFSSAMDELTEYLMRYNRLNMFWRIYGFPILWIDREQAASFSVVGPPGPGNNNSSIHDWFRFTWSFLTDKTDFRTYVGMFYTVDDDAAVDANGGRGEPPPRHPWVVVYRPVDAYRRPFTQTEVIIWDVRAPARLRSLTDHQLVREDEHLTAAQQRLVAHVREFGTEKNPGLDLTRVWIGGRQFKPATVSPSTQRPFLPHGHPGNPEFDATIKYMDILTEDMVEVLPPRDKQLEDRGFRQMGQPKENGDRTDEEDNEKCGKVARWCDWLPACAHKGIVRPPRPPPMFHRPSKCGNILLASAQKARLARPGATSMTFTYRPTTDWYREQVDEGRGFEHLHVDAWQTFFKTYNVVAPSISHDVQK